MPLAGPGIDLRGGEKRRNVLTGVVFKVEPALRPLRNFNESLQNMYMYYLLI